MPNAMPSVTDLDPLDRFPDLQSVPRHRFFAQHDLVDLLRKAVPFDYIAIGGLDLDRYRLGSGFSIDTNLPPEYLEAYYLDKLQKTDPFVRVAKQALSVVREHEVLASEPASQRLLYLKRRFGIFNRTLFPISRGNVPFGGICVMREQRFTDAEIAFLTMTAEPLHRFFTAPLMDKFGAQELNLTAGEIACLKAASTGQTSEKIADLLGYQVETVNSYIKAGIKKLGAANRVEAIAEAIHRRIIP